VGAVPESRQTPRTVVSVNRARLRVAAFSGQSRFLFTT
jgi:hypothetical protein